MTAHWYEPALTLRREIEAVEPKEAKRFIRGLLNCGSSEQAMHYVDAWRKAWDSRTENEPDVRSVQEPSGRGAASGSQPPGTAVDVIAATDVLRRATPSLRRMAGRRAYRYRTH